MKTIFAGVLLVCVLILLITVGKLTAELRDYPAMVADLRQQLVDIPRPPDQDWCLHQTANEARDFMSGAHPGPPPLQPDNHERTGEVWQWVTNSRHEWLYRRLGKGGLASDLKDGTLTLRKIKTEWEKNPTGGRMVRRYPLGPMVDCQKD